MIVLETKKIFDHLIELKFLKNERHRRPLKILVPVCATVLSIIVLLSMILDLVLGVDTRKNFYKVSITFGAISSFAAIILIYWHLIINRERYYTLLNDMQQILNDTCKLTIEYLCKVNSVAIRHCASNSRRIGRTWNVIRKGGSKDQARVECRCLRFDVDTNHVFLAVH